MWVHETLLSQDLYGEFNLVKELMQHHDKFQSYFRLDKQQFDTLLMKVGPLIAKMDIEFLCSISPAERLAIRLSSFSNYLLVIYRYLATGDSYTTIASSYRMGVSTSIVPSVAQVIWDCLVEEYMSLKRVSGGRLPLISSRGGTEVEPASSGSLFFNYKGTFSIVLLSVVDARYRFRVVDVGAYGRNSDGGTLALSPFGKNLQAGCLNLPEDSPLPNAEHLGPIPHVFVGDEAFPLRKDLLRPFPGRQLRAPQRVFNYRLS
ncbi:hypothetical protein SKAU_G00020670 [Synaphobranchus kaupii]|uniref:DDE Tnp4 domain-containing protein n=1 Tax=Synaphobranchus kaupii TaxID=118154 RepID=A0A9Q1GBT9_SYNKA|nr:hypothetical protein SKAU_G00020670 [Synaphobranchus kaupii]